MTSLYSHDIYIYWFYIYWFYFSGLSNRIMRKTFSHCRLEPVRGGSRRISEGFDVIILPYLLYVFGQTGKSNSVDPYQTLQNATLLKMLCPVWYVNIRVGTSLQRALRQKSEAGNQVIYLIRFTPYLCEFPTEMGTPQLAFYVNLHRAVIGPSATLTGLWRPDIDLRRMLTGDRALLKTHLQSIKLSCLFVIKEI